LRDLQERRALEALLGAVAHRRDEHARRTLRLPLLVKIAPDLDAEALSDIVEVCLAAGIDGIIVSNTTVSRPPLRSPHATEEGGLSGRPLFDLSTRTLARVYRVSEDRLPLIGVGGIDSAEAAWQKVRAGASLLQLYTALVYRGPDLIGEILEGLAQRVKAHRLSSMREAVGSGADEWASGN
jgi:dihydroorotate dehydrogenase